MGWPTIKNEVGRKIGLLAAIASAMCCAISLMYTLSTIMPLWYFYGYVVGYYSLLEYELYYTYSGQPIPMPHTDYVKHVSMTFTSLSLGLLVLSAASILLSLRRPCIAAGLVYGIAAGLGVLYSLLTSYLYRAVRFDLGRFSSLIGGEKTLKTSAGTIVYEGVRIEPTFIHELVFTSSVILITLMFSIGISAVATALALHSIHKPVAKRLSVKRDHAPVTIAPLMLALFVLASVFTYYPSSLLVNPQPPPATLEEPLYVYTCTGLTRIERKALTYTDFEIYPVPGWMSYGGTWSSISGVMRAKGNALQGIDNNRGLGDASHYYYNYDYEELYRSLWVVAKTRHVSGSGYYGIVLFRSPPNRMYTVTITTAGYITIRSYGVENPPGWYTLSSAIIPGYSITSWYIIAVNYSVTGTAVNITARVYSSEGLLLASVSASSTSVRRFTPAYLGVTIDDVTAYFDDFLIATSDPRNIYLTGLTDGMSAEIWDNLGSRVTFGIADGATLPLSIVHDVVVGTGVDGRIIIRFPDNSLCIDHKIPDTDAILGGDAYRLETAMAPPPGLSVRLGANKTSATVTMNISGSSNAITTAMFLGVFTFQVLQARLVLDEVSAPSTLHLDLWIEGIAKSTNITIRNGITTSASTSIIQLNLGGDNHLVLSGYFTTTGQSATLHLRLELCTAPGSMGACVSYPLLLMLMS